MTVWVACSCTVFPSKRVHLFLPYGVKSYLSSSMKLDKNVVQRRLDLMAQEGVVSFKTFSDSPISEVILVDLRAQCQRWGGL